jgi:hypothetical protein
MGTDGALQGLKIFFKQTLKFSKFVTLIKKDARRRKASSPGSTQFLPSLPPRFHRGATTIRQGLSDKLLRVFFVIRGRKIQTVAYTVKVSAQSECIPLAIQQSQVQTEQRER